MAGSVNNIKIQPVNVTWEIEQQTCVQTVADVAESLDGKYFTLNSGATSYYAWMDIGLAADPAPAGKTGIAVVASANDSASVIAGLIAAAVDANPDFSASAVGALVTITNADTSDVDDAADVDTGFVISTTQEGGSLDMGLLEGDIDSSFEEQLLDITAHQTGSTILTSLRQGVSADISLTMQETNVAKLKEVFAHTAGAAFTPGSGTEVFGWGTSRLGSNVIVQSRRLKLSPVGAPDASEDLTFWKAYPKPESLVYSGENPKTLTLSFGIYRDELRDARISYFMFGDSSQAGL